MLLRKISFLLLAAAIVYPLVIQIVFPRFTIDDAFITFRYAENLALRGELNWNVGEDPVEGYTGVALPVLLAGAITAGIDPEAASRVIGVASFWFSFLMLFLIGRRIQLPFVGIAGFLFLFATTPILYTHALSGLETMLFLALLLSVLCASLYRKDTILLVLLLMTSLVRPEGVAFSVIILCATGWWRYREDRILFKRFLRQTISIYILPALAYFLWRFNYYGRLLPNTFYAKSGVGFQVDALIDIARFLRRYFAVPSLGVAVLFAAETDLLWESVKRFCRERKAIVLVIAGILFNAVLVAFFSRTHLTMNFSHRFYTMLLPATWLLLLFCIRIGFTVLASTKTEKPVRYRFILGMLALLIMYQTAFQAVKARDEFTFANSQIILQKSEHTRIGKMLRELVPADATLSVHADAGAIPYFSKLHTIDFGGLNDEYLSFRGLSPQEITEYFYERRPDISVFTSVDGASIIDNTESAAILSDPRFHDYVLFNRFAPGDAKIRYYEFVYLRKDLYEKLKKEGKI